MKDTCIAKMRMDQNHKKFWYLVQIQIESWNLRARTLFMITFFTSNDLRNICVVLRWGSCGMVKLVPNCAPEIIISWPRPYMLPPPSTSRCMAVKLEIINQNWAKLRNMVEHYHHYCGAIYTVLRNICFICFRYPIFYCVLFNGACFTNKFLLKWMLQRNHLLSFTIKGNSMYFSIVKCL